MRFDLTRQPRPRPKSPKVCQYSKDPPPTSLQPTPHWLRTHLRSPRTSQSHMPLRVMSPFSDAKKSLSRLPSANATVNQPPSQWETARVAKVSSRPPSAPRSRLARSLGVPCAVEQPPLKYLNPQPVQIDQPQKVRIERPTTPERKSSSRSEP